MALDTHCEPSPSYPSCRIGAVIGGDEAAQKESVMTALFVVIGVLILLDVLALRFGADSRQFDDRATAWW